MKRLYLKIYLTIVVALLAVVLVSGALDWIVQHCADFLGAQEVIANRLEGGNPSHFVGFPGQTFQVCLLG